MRFASLMKYLIVGTGGTGGSIGGLLASNGHDISFISRGKNLEALKQNGLVMKTGIKGELHLPKIKVFSENEYQEKADVIFVCVKSYSLDDVIPFIGNSIHENSIVIPIMNGYGMGGKIAGRLVKASVLDGCIYISAFIDAAGSITQLGKLFRIVFGPRKGESSHSDIIHHIKDDLCNCGIEGIVSADIERDTFKKFSFISSYASCAAYFDISAQGMQEAGRYRDTYMALCEEMKFIGNRLEVTLDVDITEANLKIVDSLTPDTTSSLQKDMNAGKQSEMDGLIFEVMRTAEKFRLDLPVYRMISTHFGYSS